MATAGGRSIALWQKKTYSRCVFGQKAEIIAT